MARNYGEPPNQKRTKKYRTSRGGMSQAQMSAQAKKQGAPGLQTAKDIVEYYKQNPTQAVKDFVLASNPATVGSVIGYEASKGNYADAALTAAGVVPGVGGLGKVAKGVSIVSKASKASKAATAARTGAAAAKKATKAAAAKKTAKTAKATKPSTTWKDRLPRPAQVSKPSSPQVTPGQVAKQRARGAAAMEGKNPSLKSPARRQPKRKNIKTDAPGTGSSSGNQQGVPARKPKYKPEKTSSSGKAEYSESGVRDTPMSQEEVAATLKKFGFDEKAPFGPRATGETAGYEGKFAAHQRANARASLKSRRTRGVTKKTPIGRERSEAALARQRKAGGRDKVRNADADEKLGGNRTIAGMKDAELEKALADPRSSASRLLRQLEKRARRGNLREGELQTLNKMREFVPEAVSKRTVKDLTANNIRKSGQPVGVNAGTINPPRTVKASNQKWRGEGGKDAPKGPAGKSGTPKRGDNAAMRAKEEDGVTRIKGKGGQRRRQVAPSTELVSTRKPGTRARRTGGSSSSGRKPIALGSGRRGTDVAPRQTRGEVVKGEVVKGGRTSGERVRTEPIDLKTRPKAKPPVKGTRKPKEGASSQYVGRPKRTFAMPGKAAITSGSSKAAKATKGKRSKRALAGKIAGGGALTGAAVGGALYGIGQAGKGQDPKPTTKPTKPKKNLRDKYGREISREEYNKREAYRESLKGMSKAEQKKARKAEMARREEYRKGKGKRANTITRNLDIREGVSSRKVNREMKAAAGKSGNRQAAIEARKKYQRKKK